MIDNIPIVKVVDLAKSISRDILRGVPYCSHPSSCIEDCLPNMTFNT